MRTALAGGIALVAAYLMGRWYLRAPETTPALPISLPATTSRLPLSSLTPGSVASPAHGEARPSVSRPAAGAGSTDGQLDTQLEIMMTEHRDAMLMLREAVVYEYFKRGSPLAGCGARVTDKHICWIRFSCELHGQLMTLRMDRIDCGEHPDVERGSEAVALTDCVRNQLKIGEPLGIPAEAAEDLGDYTGPLEVSLTYAPEE